jgi:AcrR family transcriptional regulator
MLAMVRKYDGTRRAEAARRTREQILAAAFRLHGEGVLDFETLAHEANVSVPTVRKHFPTRELLFEDCTAYGLHLVPMPDIDAIREIGDPVQRMERTVREMYRLHEALLGQAWTAYQHEHESPALAAVLRQIEDTVAIAAQQVLDAWWRRDGGEEDGLRRLLLGMLSPLAYRALRVHGGLSPAEAIARTAQLLEAALTASASREEAAHR